MSLGLAFSGGGIRSAAFMLGCLKSFEKHRVASSPALPYRPVVISCVSGGGFTGSAFLNALRKGRTLNEMEEYMTENAGYFFRCYQCPQARTRWRSTLMSSD